MSIAHNVAVIKENIAKAAIAAGRDPKDIKLCAATKMNGADAVRQAIAAGVDCCGENRVQELTAKLAENAYEGAPIHFIGRLQTNKVKQVVGKVSLIHSVDRLNLLEAIQKEAARQGIVQDILLQVNIGHEDSKGGFWEDELLSLLPKMPNFPNVQVKGLMAIPPQNATKEENLNYFTQTYQFFVDFFEKKVHNNIDTYILSMGMSDSYEDAVRSGSTLVRVGSAIFGKRFYPEALPTESEG